MRFIADEPLDAPKAPAANPVMTYLDVSIGHLRLADREALFTGELQYQSMVGDYGGLLYVPNEITDPDDASDLTMACSDELWAILKRAASLGCYYVKFDVDGLVLEGFPSFDDDGKPEVEEGSQLVEF